MLLAAGDLLIADLNASGGPGAIFQVSPGTGAQTTVASFGNFVEPSGLALAANGALYVADSNAVGGPGAIIGVNLSDGTQTVVSSFGNFVDPVAIAIGSNGALFVVDLNAFGGPGGVIRVDPSTGAQTVVSSGNNFVDPDGIAIAANGDLLVTDRNASGGSGAVIRVNPGTGAQTVVSSGGNFVDPSGIAIAANGDLYVVDSNALGGPGGVIRVDAGTGAQTVVSSGGNFVDPSGIALAANGDLYVTDPNAFGGPGGVIRVDPNGGSQTVISSGNNFVDPVGIAIVPPGPATHFAINVPTGAITGNAFNFTVTAEDATNNIVTGYSGTVHFSSSDAAASVPANASLSNGIGTFSATLRTTGSQMLSATDTVSSSITGTSAAVTVRGLVVTAFSVTPTGFTVQFSKPFVNSTSQPIHLYDAASAKFGPADVTMVGQTTGSVRGSLVFDATSTSFTFIKTGSGSGGLLAADTYTVTFMSGALGFQELSGAALDGNNDGTAGDDYTNSFTVAASPAVIVSIPDLARGPDGTDAINVPNNSSNGIPIILSGGSGVTSGSFTLVYNPALLSVTGGHVNAALSGASFTLDPSSSPGTAILNFSSSTSLPSGAVHLGGLTATVPSNATYRALELLHFSSLALNSGTIPAIGDDGIHVAAFLGDASGDGAYSSADSVLLSRVAARADTGFAAFPVVDPAIIGDIHDDGRVTAAAAALLNRYLSGTTVPLLPPYPGAPSNDPSSAASTVRAPALEVTSASRIPTTDAARTRQFARTAADDQERATTAAVKPRAVIVSSFIVAFPLDILAAAASRSANEQFAFPVPVSVNPLSPGVSEEPHQMDLNDTMGNAAGGTAGELSDGFAVIEFTWFSRQPPASGESALAGGWQLYHRG